MWGRVYVMVDGIEVLSRNKQHIPEGYYIVDRPASPSASP
jgi:hypothetical protein